MGCCLWGRTESDTTEATEQQQQQHELLKPVLHNKRSHALRSLHSSTRGKPPLAAARERLHAAKKTQGSQKIFTLF